MAPLRFFLVPLVSLPLALAIQSGARANEEKLGEVGLPISCSAAAQKQFNRAVAMLHSFFFPETVKAFSAIAQDEPSCAMAYWGIAISQRPNPLVGPFPGNAARSGDAAAAQQAVEQLRVLKAKLARANDDYWTGQVEIQETAAMAWILLREGQKDKAITLMRRAADLEDRSGKHVAMENRLSPMRELLGELLLEAREPARALKELEASLTNTPNRYRSYAAAANAAEMAANRQLAKTYSEKLLDLAGSADSERPDMIAAHRRLTNN